MQARPAVLGIIICILILTSGCIDVAVTSAVNGAGDIERYQMTLATTGTVYAMLVQSATSGGYASVEEMVEHPRGQTGPDPQFDYREEWNRDEDRVTITVTARNPNAMREKKSVSVMRDGEYLIYRADLSSMAGGAATDQESPYASRIGSMFTVRYTLTMPGEIIESNADTISGTTAEWHRTTSTVPMIYAKSKVSPFPVALVGGAGAVLLIALLGGVVLYRRSRRDSMPPAETGRWEPAPVPAAAPSGILVASGVTYTPYTPTRRPDAMRHSATNAQRRPRSDRVLRYALIAGTVLLVALVAGVLIEASLHPGAAPAGPTDGLTAADAATPGSTVPTLPPATAAAARVPNAATAPSAPIRIDGTGDDVAIFTASGADLRIFSMQHTGSSWFFVEVIDAAGGVDYLAAQLGQYSGRATDYLGDGRYTLQVRADGPWTIEVSPAVALVSGPGRKSLPAATQVTLPFTVATPPLVIPISDPVYSAPPVIITTTPPQQPQQPAPRYQAGDIINDRPTNQGTAWMILGYDPGTDEYDWCIVSRYDDGHWGFRLISNHDWNQREFVEKYYATLITHVDPGTVPIGPPLANQRIITTTPTTPEPITTTPEPITTTPQPITTTPEPITTTPTPIVITTTPTPPKLPGPDTTTPRPPPVPVACDSTFTTPPTTLPLPYRVSTVPTPPLGF